MSLGGCLAARSAAFEHRLQAVILYDGVYDFSRSVKQALPKEALAAFEAHEAARCEHIVREAMKTNTNLQWAVNNGIWTLGASDVSDLIEKSRVYSLAGGVATLIQCPTLVMEAEADIFFAGQPQQVYDNLRVAETLAKFSPDFGAENHCQSGELSYKDEVVVNWLDKTIDNEYETKS